jgi:putative NADH-flavin reductase
MNLVIFGASGGTGREAVRQALALGHNVTAVVRNPQNFSEQSPNLTILTGDVTRSEQIQPALAGQSAVIISLGGRKDTVENVCTVGTQHILSAMQATQIRRVLVVTSMGVGDSKSQVPFAFRVIMNTFLKKAFEDKETQEEAVRASNLDWTIVRPSGLVDGAVTGTYLAGERIAPKQGRIARADVAHYILANLENSETFGKAVTVTY